MFPLFKEASLALNASNEELRRAIQTSLLEEAGVDDPWSDKAPWVQSVFPTHVVYQQEGKTWKRKYKVTTGAEGQGHVVTFSGDKKPVHVAYVDSKEASNAYMLEAADVNFTPEGDTVTVTEGLEIPITARESKSSLTTIPIKIIGPGWGSSAYYSKEVLARDGPKVFKKGTHMMWNHPTATEESERPEGDLSDLAAVLTKDAYWDENGTKGPGLYSEAKVFSDYADQVSDKGPYIGVSINAAIQTHEGEAEGKRGRIADKFVYAFSTDFVTKAGAGGAPIVSATESDRAPIKEKETVAMTDQEIKALRDSITALEGQMKTLTEENTKLKSEKAAMEAEHNRITAVATVGATLREAGIEYNPRLLERACANPTMKEGKLDTAWAEGVVKDFSEGINGQVTGMGNSKESGNNKKGIQDDEMKKVWSDLGVPEGGLEVAMGGR